MTKEYWAHYFNVGGPTLETMMLDSNASLLDAEDRAEMLSIVPDFSGKSVLELGAGIGRYTRALASKAATVTAVDFMEAATEQNRTSNGSLGNINFITADVNDLEATETDMVFSNWLLMYLSDAEVSSLLIKLLNWLTEDGVFVFRESCFHQSGDRKTRSVAASEGNPGSTAPQNPTNYRSLIAYVKLLSEAKIVEVLGDGRLKVSTFDLLEARCMATYLKHKNNCNQLCFLYAKRVSIQDAEDQAANENFQRFLDLNQYTKDGILRYERIFGHGFVSTGGSTTTEEVVRRLNLQPGQRVLDVGCGIGGSALYMARNFQVNVLGLDLSTNMVDLALQRTSSAGGSPLVQYRISDVTTAEFEEGSFDVIYSRDTLLHIADKAALFKKFYKWLRPGGQVLITDYCQSAIETSEEFRAYVASRGYHLLNVPMYGATLGLAGFSAVTSVDYTPVFVESLSRELELSEAEKDRFVADFSEEDYDYIVQGWRQKLIRCAAGDQKWGLFHATK